MKSFLTFVAFAKMRVTMRFRMVRDIAQGYLRSMPPHIGDPVVRTDGRSRDYYVTIIISWLDMLPNLLSNGPPLARNARGLR